MKLSNYFDDKFLQENKKYLQLVLLDNLVYIIYAAVVYAAFIGIALIVF